MLLLRNDTINYVNHIKYNHLQEGRSCLKAFSIICINLHILATCGIENNTHDKILQKWDIYLGALLH